MWKAGTCRETSIHLFFALVEPCTSEVSHCFISSEPFVLVVAVVFSIFCNMSPRLSSWNLFLMSVMYEYLRSPLHVCVDFIFGTSLPRFVASSTDFRLRLSIDLLLCLSIDTDASSRPAMYPLISTNSLCIASIWEVKELIVRSIGK